MKFITITTPGEEATIAVEAIDAVLLEGSRVVVYRRNAEGTAFGFNFVYEDHAQAAYQDIQAQLDEATEQNRKWFPNAVKVPHEKD